MKQDKTNFIESTNRNRKQKSFKEFKQFSKEKTFQKQNDNSSTNPKENLFFGPEDNLNQFVFQKVSLNQIDNKKFSKLMQGYFHDSNIQSFDGEKIELKQHLDQLNVYDIDQHFNDYQNLLIQQDLFFDESFNFQLNKI